MVIWVRMPTFRLIWMRMPILVTCVRMPTSDYLGENAHLWLFGWECPPLVIWVIMPTSGYLGEDAHLWLFGWGCPSLVTWVRMPTFGYLGEDGRTGWKGWTGRVEGHSKQWMVDRTLTMNLPVNLEVFCPIVYMHSASIQNVCLYKLYSSTAIFYELFYSCSYSNIPVTSCPEAN